jgi:hypothetical protein
VVAVVAVDLAKAPAREQVAELAAALDGQALQALGVGQHVGLAGRKRSGAGAPAPDAAAPARIISPSVTSPSGRGTRFQVAPWLTG